MNIKKKPIFIKFVFAVLIIVFLLAIFFISPIFSVQTIYFTGGEKYSKDYIMSKLKFDVGENIFMLNTKKAKELLEKEPYVKNADIKVTYPDTVDIIIKERKVRGYVPYTGAYLYIDEEGKVLEVKGECELKLPLVDGLKFNGFQVGQVLDVENKEALDIVLKTSNLFIKYSDLYEDIGDFLRIDVNDTQNIHIYVRSVDVKLGDITDYDEKIRIMFTILKEIPEQDKGILDIRNTGNSWTFEYLT